MDIPLAVVKDSHGDISKAEYKYDITKPALSVWLTDNNVENDKNKINFSFNNLNVSRIDGVDTRAVSYKCFITYNGTTGKQGLFSQLVVEDEGEYINGAPPKFEYSSEDINYTYSTLPEGIVLDINFYTNEANILQFKGVPVGGNNGPIRLNTYKYTYPFKATTVPNMSGNYVYQDGWYSVTYLIVKDVFTFDSVTEGNIYSSNGRVFIATASGMLKIDITTNEMKIVDHSDNSIVLAEDVDLKSPTYEEVIIRSNDLIGDSTMSTANLIVSQVIVTKELNNAIINQIKNIACDSICEEACTIADWQKLQQKKLAAYIYFTESDFRKAQIIIESSRQLCTLSKHNTCK